MGFRKKLIALGLAGVLAAGQNVSALAAADTTFTVDVPFVKTGTATPIYEITGTVTATTANYYLSLRQWVVYVPNGLSTERTSDVKNSYSASKTRGFSYTNNIAVYDGAAKRAISRGYYSDSQGVQQNVAGQASKQIG